MEVSEEQINQLRKQVLDQINSTFPEDKKQQAAQQIESMNKEQFVEFLKQNNLVSNSENPETINNAESPPESPFRKIIQGGIPSYKISENEKSLAVLEINPVSVGHTIVIPKSPVHDASSMPKECLELAKEISEIFKKELSPKEIIVKPSSVLGEIIINVLPVYENETLESQRTQAKEEELKSLQEVLESSSINETQKQESEPPETPEQDLSEENLIIPKRIP